SAILLAVGATRIFKGAWDALMDRAAPPDMITGVEKLANDWPGVHGFHDLKTRVSGSKVFVNLHIELDGAQSLEAAHATGAALRRAILRAYPNADVMIHKDPVGVTPHPEDPSRKSVPR
ncbi:MAG TPA: cation-efflux pump, partial [Aliiroseovarius sp.]|nr:cation-efflux pump [Aliiroseovarius sp.]